MLGHRQRHRRAARGIYQGILSAVLLLGSALVSHAVGEDTPRGDPADRAAPNQSVEIDPTVDDSTALPTVDDDARASASPGDYTGATGEDDAESAAARTLRARTAGTSMLHPPGGGDLPWYRSGLGALFTVLAVIALVLIVLRRVVPAARAPEGDVLKIVARASLTPKQTLSLIQVGRRLVLVAISVGRVDPLCEIDDVDEVTQLTSAIGERSGRASPFDAQLRAERAHYAVSNIEELEETLPREDRRGWAVSDLLARLKSLQRTG